MNLLVQMFLGGISIMTKKIALFCSGGFSTSLVAKKMQDVYTAEGDDVKVDAYDLGMADELGDDVDAIVLAPQVAWDEDSMKKEHPDTKVVALTMQQFGSMDGATIVKALKEEGI